MRDEALAHLFDGRGLHQHLGRLERVEPGIENVLGRGAHVLHVDPVHLGDLSHEHGDEVRVGEVDDELVDDATRAALENVDADDVAAHGADAAGYRPQGARTVGQPQSYDEGLHDDRAYRPYVNARFRARDADVRFSYPAATRGRSSLTVVSDAMWAVSAPSAALRFA